MGDAPDEPPDPLGGDGWRRLAERAPFGVTIWRADTDAPADIRLIYSNPRAAAESGMSMQDRVGQTVGQLFPSGLDAPAKFNIPDAWMRVACSEHGETMEAVPYGDETHPMGWFRIHFVPLGDRRVASVYENVSRQMAARRELEQFADVASHDLQAPLRNIAGFVELLSKALGADLAERPKRFVEHIRVGVSQMQEHLKGLLAYARAGRDAPVEPVAVASVLAEVRLALRRPLREVNATFNRAPLPTVAVPRVALHRLLLNLIDNAVKYRADRPLHIDVTAQRRGLGWAVTVRDNGIGIAPDLQSDVFEMFRRLHPPDQRGGGAGLGLAVCRRSVELWGGRIGLESTPGQGTAVTFTVPYQSLPAAGVAPPADDPAP